jgi:hypothetical protein
MPRNAQEPVSENGQAQSAEPVTASGSAVATPPSEAPLEGSPNDNMVCAAPPKVAPTPKVPKYTATIYGGQSAEFPDGFSKAVLELKATLAKDVLMIIQASGSKFETLNDHLSTAILRECHAKPDRREIAVLLHSPGGYAPDAYRIARMLQTHCEGFVAVIPQYAKSAATLLSLGATDIIMSGHAELGPLDAQLYDPGREEPISALDEVQSLERLHAFSLEAIDRTMMLLLGRTGKKIEPLLPQILKYVADMTRPLFEKIDTVHYNQMSRALKVAEEYAIRLLENQYPADKASQIARKLVHGYPEHGFIIDIDEANSIGLDVQAAVPDVEAIMDRIRPFLGRLTAIGYLKETGSA